MLLLQFYLSFFELHKKMYENDTILHIQHISNIMFYFLILILSFFKHNLALSIMVVFSKHFLVSSSLLVSNSQYVILELKFSIFGIIQH